MTALVFTLGILFSTVIDTERATVLEEELNENLVEIESRNLQLSYLKSSEVTSCDALKEGLQNILADYNKRLERVKAFKEKSILKKDRFQSINRKYVISGVRYWMFANDLKSRCEFEADTVLFFTRSIEAEACPDCRRQGEQLSLLKKEYGEQILIFSIPVDVDDGMVDILEKQYNVTELPSLVLNSNRTMKGYHSRKEISEALGLKGGN